MLLRLRNRMHQRFSKNRLNKVNFRKEFFRVELSEIIAAVAEMHGTVDYVASPEALEYYESVSMTEEEFEFIEEKIGALPEPLDD